MARCIVTYCEGYAGPVGPLCGVCSGVFVQSGECNATVNRLDNSSYAMADWVRRIEAEWRNGNKKDGPVQAPVPVAVDPTNPDPQLDEWGKLVVK